MAARRCSICLTNWPFEVAYKTCPECDDETKVVGNADPIDKDEAARRVNHVLFQEYLESEGRV